MSNGSEIAVIGMAGRFPGARNISEFWENLRQGVESISFLTDQELLDSGVDPLLLQHPQYVKAKACLEDAEYFDALFFGYSPREAEIMDPQHRIFLEEAYHALEEAGYIPEQYKGAIGLYAGADTNTYLINNLLPNSHLLAAVGGLQLLISNEKNHILTRASYQLDLKGPSINIQSACSTSLAAIHIGCQSLLSGECDMVLAGGISVSSPLKNGYLYEKGMISSPDGHCRAFDEKARGTVSGNGVGIVVLKMLENALADGDHIYAVIKGSAVNNDGSLKVGYTAPGIDGQARVVAEALAISGVEPQTIQYIETNGTGSEMGDPIEVEALTKAYRKYTDQTNFCAIGSVKTNIGHLNEAAGIAGFIKTVCALRHQQIPPSLHYQRPNPNIDFDKSPFFVASQLLGFKREKHVPMRAGVNAFGIGGTNAHIVLEEAPVSKPSGKSAFPSVLVLSAKTKTALEAATQQLSSHLLQKPDLNLADVAYTLQVGRKAYNHRRMVVCGEDSHAGFAVDNLKKHSVYESGEPSRHFLVGILEGNAPVNLAAWESIYHHHPVFKQAFDACATTAQALFRIDLRRQWQGSTSPQPLTAVLPLAFSLEYALAQLLQSWGVQPQAFVGLGLGEYVAAVVTKVMTPEDALRLLHQLAEAASESDELPPDGWLKGLVESGRFVKKTALAMAGAQEEAGREVLRSWNDCLADFRAACSKVEFRAPKPAYFSAGTGTWVKEADLKNADYWLNQLSRPVATPTVKQALSDKKNVLLLKYGEESSPQRAAALAGSFPEITVLNKEYASASLALAHAVGNLWVKGVNIQWKNYSANEKRYRIPLPTYPFERQPYWIKGRNGITALHQNQDSVPSSPAVSLQRTADNPYLAPRTDTEQALVTVWGNLFGLKGIGIRDHFFDMGGHSLLGIQILSKVREQFKLDLPITCLYERPTIAELGEFIDTKLWLIQGKDQQYTNQTNYTYEEGTL